MSAELRPFVDPVRAPGHPVIVGERLRSSRSPERTRAGTSRRFAMAGIPVYSQAGRGGGWSLLGGAPHRPERSDRGRRLERCSWSRAPSAAATPQIKAALRKLVRALPSRCRGRRRGGRLRRGASTRQLGPRARPGAGAPGRSSSGRSWTASGSGSSTRRPIGPRPNAGASARSGREGVGLVPRGRDGCAGCGRSASTACGRSWRPRTRWSGRTGFDLEPHWRSVIADLTSAG